VFVRDLNTGQLLLVSTNDLGTKGNGQSSAPSLSGDGRKVAFVSYATNLDPAMTVNGLAALYLKDLSTGDLSLVSRNAAGNLILGGISAPSMSADATRIAFDASSTNAHPADADSLSDVFELLTPPPVELSEDEIRRLGVVLILRRLLVRGEGEVRGLDEEGTIRRVVAAHYLRPAERDGEGHVQRRPPVALAAWDPDGDAFDRYSWGAAPELALRVGRSQAELERELALRTAFLGEVTAAGRTSVPAFRAALATYRGGGSAHSHPHSPA
jgi:hypothetical protein